MTSTLITAKQERAQNGEPGMPKVNRLALPYRPRPLWRNGVELSIYTHRCYTNERTGEHWKSNLESGSIDYTNPELLALARALVAKCEEAQGKKNTSSPLDLARSTLAYYEATAPGRTCLIDELNPCGGASHHAGGMSCPLCSARAALALAKEADIPFEPKRPGHRPSTGLSPGADEADTVQGEANAEQRTIHQVGVGSRLCDGSLGESREDPQRWRSQQIQDTSPQRAL